MPKSRPSAISQSAPLPTSADPDFGFLVIGSGFAGSLIATILQTQGRRVAIVDRTSHPRFAIGESSTPAASLILSSLAQQYDLTWLKPFAKYGTWKKSYPNITTGRKRGFSYFHHEAGKPFKPQADHSNELLAAASASDEVSDTQWLRSDVDAFFFKKACESGVVPFESSEITSLARSTKGWTVELTSTEQGVAVPTKSLFAGFLIDASGAGQVLARHLNIRDETDNLATNSRAIFGHVTGLPQWSTSLEQSHPGSTTDHPFNADHAAQHHILEEGWLWSLRFDNDITSVGLVLNDLTTARSSTLSAEEEFFQIINRYPGLHAAFSQVTFTSPSDKPVRTKRLQRLSSEIAGDDWAMLPHTAGFIDPLHSTGIAHSLAGVERLAAILLTRNPTVSNALPDPMLQLYGSIVREELTLIDQLVAGCYDAIAEGSFKKIATFTMCYFAAATTWERLRLNDESTLTSNISPNLKTRSVSEGQDSAPTFSSNLSLTRRVTMPSNFEHPALLNANNHAFREAVFDLRAQMPHETAKSFESLCKETLSAFNHVGLFEPPIPNMYGATALPEH